MRRRVAQCSGRPSAAASLTSTILEVDLQTAGTKEYAYDDMGARMSRFVSVNLMMSGGTANNPRGDEMAGSTVQQKAMGCDAAIGACGEGCEWARTLASWLI